MNLLARGAAAGLLAAVVTWCAAPASADIIHIESLTNASTEGHGQFTGSLAYEFDVMSETGLLTVTLTNTTTDEFGSLITGIVFNIGSDDSNRTSTLLSTDHEAFHNVNNEPAPPFGMNFDGGAAIGANWLGGGNPSGGIAPGNTGTFAFEIVASDAMDLSAASFLEGQYPYNFIVRFRGGDFSDKVPAIPAPAGLAAFALAGLLASRRRRRA